MTEIPTAAIADSPAHTSRARRRRRFLIVSVGALAVLAAALGVSFTADTGTASVSVSAGTSAALVYPITNSATLVTGIQFTRLPHTLDAAIDQTLDPDSVTTAQTASWSPVAGTAGSVTTAGDLFVIDARTASAGNASNIVLNIYITNLAALQSSYSSYAWPMKIYQGDAASGTVASFAKVTSPFNTDNYFLTHTGGVLSFTVPTGANRFYAITMDTGGSYYTISTAGTLGPNFYVTAQPA